jgi:membrane protease YdiL (CAAX protease family)
MVTLVVAPSSSGEPEPAPRGRRWAAQLGTFSFGIGIIMANWHLAAMGVLYSTLTATAMWQNFRERLPFLFDPESERLPPPPTLLHAMVAISAMVDGMAIVSIPVLLFAGLRNLMAAQTIAYGLTAAITWIATSSFLQSRGVTAARIWRWPAAEQSSGPAFVERLRAVDTPFAQLLLAAGIGMALGAFGLLYQTLVFRVPWIHEHLGSSGQLVDPTERWWLAAAAIGLAPWAEEFLFRGLLLRALDREWGGWWAILGTTLFFTIYHPAIAWVPVGVAGLALALLFKATGRLLPGVLLHTVYNAIVSLAP